MRKSLRPETTRSKSGRKGSSSKEPLNLPEDDDDVPVSRKKKKRSSKTVSNKDAVDGILDLLEAEKDGGEPSDPFKFAKSKKDFDKLKDYLAPDNAEFNIDAASNIFLRSSASTIADLIPIAEATYRTTKKEFAAYALSSLVKQLNELIAELRVSGDVEGKLLTITQIIQSSFVRIAELLLREKFNLHKTIESVSNDPVVRKELRRELDVMIQSYGKGLSQQKDLLTQQLTMFISGNPNYMNPFAASEEEEAPKKKKRKKNG